MKIIGWKKKGNLVRFALGEDWLEEWWGDDYSDRPYEHNASDFPYDEYISEYIDIVFYWNVSVQEAADDWHYEGNSPFSMQDFIERKAPILVLAKQENDWEWPDNYSRLVCSDNTDKLYKIYMGDDIKTVMNLHQFGEMVRSSTNV